VCLVEAEDELGAVEIADPGRFSNSSERSQSRKLEYSRGFRIS
jgi:hypothetical protein